MELTRIMAMILPIALGTGAGLYFSCRLKMREEALRELTQVLREMSLLIRHRALPVKDLFVELSRYEFIAKISKNNDFREFRENWVEACDELTELEKSEREILKSVGLALGTSDVEGQISMLEVNAQLLSKSCDEAHEMFLKKGKMYRSIGMLAGLFVAIMTL
jgi:stage III sporulation protein AB